MKQIIIIGGGLAGLVSSILLARKGFGVTIYEKKHYPFHRVCGEYISNEVRPFLERNGLFPDSVVPSEVKHFQFTSVKGKSMELPLDLGGFGISRFRLDHWLYERALEAGVEVITKTSVVDLVYENDHFALKAHAGTDRAQIVVGAHGKNSVIDKKLNRSFVSKRAPYIGVKYHIRADFPKDKIALHNFPGGYCGISAIEDDQYNLCYLGSRDQLKKHGSIAAMEEAVVKRNPHLKQIYENSEFLFDKPEVINEFTFAPKAAVENHVLMTGDSAGLITPLCGNGMAMAIHSAYILSECIQKHFQSNTVNRANLEAEYSDLWASQFSRRLKTGRLTQQLFGSRLTSEVAVWLMKRSSAIAYQIMKNTHGQPF